MKHSQYCKSAETFKKKLLELHLNYPKEPSKPLETWFNNFFKKTCGLGFGDSFKNWTLWGHMLKRKATFKTYFRPERVNPKYDFEASTTVKNGIKYRIFLATHNLDADNDMSDSYVMYIEFQIMDNEVYNYSFHFGH